MTSALHICDTVCATSNAPLLKPMTTTNFTVRLDSAMLDKFKMHCKLQCTTPTAAIKNFIVGFSSAIEVQCNVSADAMQIIPTPVSIDALQAAHTSAMQIIPTPSSEMDVRSIVADMMREQGWEKVEPPLMCNDGTVVIVDIDREKVREMIDHSLSVYSAQQAELADDVDIYDYINEQVRKSMHRHRLTVEFSEQINTSIGCTVKEMMTRDGKIQEMVAEMITGEWDGSIPILNSVEVAALIDEKVEEINHLWFETHCRIERIESRVEKII